MNKKQELTQEFIKTLFDYDSLTGVITWKERDLSLFKRESRGKVWNTRYANKPVGSISKVDGYVETSINDKSYRVHRLVWLYVYGYFPKHDIDHINGIRHDNRICNLREAERKENLQNLRKCRSTNKTSGLLGVHFNKKRNLYIAQITIDGHTKTVGCFNDKIDAYNCYVQSKRKIHLFGML